MLGSDSPTSSRKIGETMDIYLVQVQREHDGGEDDVTPYTEKDRAMSKVNELIDYWVDAIARTQKTKGFTKDDVQVGMNAWHMENNMFDVTIHFKHYIIK